MKPAGIITMTTDFGYRDPFVGQMKGSLLSIHPQAILVDLTHDISSHDIAEAAFVLSESYPWFPRGTIHLVVVDPGVGSERRAIIVSADNHFFIGPDNGSFSLVIRNNRHYHAVCIDNEHYTRPSAGPTFHGRDIFAPAAAWLARGVEMTAFGPVIDDVCLLEIPRAVAKGLEIAGEVIYVDKFGNGLTNIRKGDVAGESDAVAGIQWRDGAVTLVPYYGASPDEELHALFNSSGNLELFVNRMSAAARYGIRKGDKVTITLSPSSDIPTPGA